MVLEYSGAIIPNCPENVNIPFAKNNRSAAAPRLMLFLLGFPHPIYDHLKFIRYIGISLLAVGKGAVFAAFDPVFQIDKIAAALPAQHVERAVAKQAVEILFLCIRMAREVFAGTVLKKVKTLFFHNVTPVSAPPTDGAAWFCVGSDHWK